jgi:hypothetical protein
MMADDDIKARQRLAAHLNRFHQLAIAIEKNNEAISYILSPDDKAARLDEIEQQRNGLSKVFAEGMAAMAQVPLPVTPEALDEIERQLEAQEAKVLPLAELAHMVVRHMYRTKTPEQRRDQAIRYLKYLHRLQWWLDSMAKHGAFHIARSGAGDASVTVADTVQKLHQLLDEHTQAIQAVLGNPAAMVSEKEIRAWFGEMRRITLQFVFYVVPTVFPDGYGATVAASTPSANKPDVSRPWVVKQGAHPTLQ